MASWLEGSQVAWRPLALGGRAQRRFGGTRHQAPLNRYTNCRARDGCVQCSIDVVLVADPAQPDRRVLRRVAALAGSEVVLRGGGLSMDSQGARLAEMGRAGPDIVLSESNRYLVQRADRRFAEPDRSWQIGADQVFVLADEREGPVDSRWWGPLPSSAVQGRLWWRLTGTDAWRAAPAQRAQDGPWIPVSKQKPEEGA